jgi:hypothetical protein
MFGYYFDPTSANVRGPLEFKFASNNLFGTIAVRDEVNGKDYLLAHGSNANYISSTNLAVLEFLQKNTWEDMDMMIEVTFTLASAASIALNAATALGGNVDKRGYLIATWTGATKSGSQVWVIGGSAVGNSWATPSGQSLTLAYSTSNYRLTHALGEVLTINLKFIGDN